MNYYLLLAASILFGWFYTTSSVAIKLFSKKKISEHYENIDKTSTYESFTANISMLIMLCGLLRVLSSITIYFSVIKLFEIEQIEHDHLLPLAFTAIIALIFSVAIPIPMARYNSDQFLIQTIPLLNATIKLFSPIIYILKFSDLIVKRISNHNPENDDDAADRILYMVEEHEEEGEVDEEQKLMIEAVFDLKETTADQIMTPRTDVMGLEIDATLEDVKLFIDAEGHSRIPVYKDNLDHIVGILYAKDLLKFLATDQKFEIKENLRDVLVIPESKIITDLLREFKAQKVHIAMVLDEYGGTAGLITIEDILEELVGEIEDEFETPETTPTIIPTKQGTYEVDARVYMDDLNDQLKIDLPEEEDYDTVGGFVFSTLGHIPYKGEKFKYEDIHITVTQAERTKVLRVEIKLPKDNPKPELAK